MHVQKNKPFHVSESDRRTVPSQQFIRPLQSNSPSFSSSSDRGTFTVVRPKSYPPSTPLLHSRSNRGAVCAVIPELKDESSIGTQSLSKTTKNATTQYGAVPLDARFDARPGLNLSESDQTGTIVATSQSQVSIPLLDTDSLQRQSSDDQGYFTTETLMRETRQAYLCEFQCSFERELMSEEKQKKMREARCRLWCATIFCIIFMFAELVGGYLSHSLALLSDALHLLSDVISLLIAIFSLWLSSLPSGKHSRYSFGYQRAEILGALLSCFIIWILTAALVYEAIRRILHPPKVDGKIMFIVACCGIGVNLIMAAILGSEHGHSHGGLSGGHGHGHGHSHGHSHGRKSKKQVTNHARHNYHKNSTETTKTSLLDHRNAKESLFGAAVNVSDDTGSGLTVNTVITHHSKRQSTDEKDQSHSDSYNNSDHRNKDKNKKGDDNKEKSQRNINLRSALIHVIGDLIQSIGVVIAGGLIWYDNKMFHYADPTCTLMFSVIVILTTRYLIRDAFSVLMESVPTHIDTEQVSSELLKLPDVREVHDLHVWMLSMGQAALSVHLIVNPEERHSGIIMDSKISDICNQMSPPLVPKRVCVDAILRKAQRLCKDKYGIGHATIQIEWPRLKGTNQHADCPSYCDSPDQSVKDILNRHRNSS